MQSILNWLFESELSVPLSQMWEHEYARAGEEAMRRREVMRRHLSQEEQGHWQAYLKQQDSYHDLERKLEFRRGFYLASRLFLELTKGEMEL